MVYKATRLFSVAAMVVLAGSAGAQQPPPTPVPVAPFPPPSANGSVSVLPAPVQVPSLPASPESPWRPAPAGIAPPPPAVLYDRGVRPLGGEPFADPPTCPPPGFFGALEIGILAPQFHNGLVAPVTVAGNTHAVSVPGAGLDWTGSPRIAVGYRLDNGAGAFTAAFRSLVSQGSSTLPNYDPLGDGFVHSRLNANIVDLDYSVTPFEVAPFWILSWSVGARIATAYYDSRVTGLAVQQQVSNNYVSGGPHVGIEIARQLEVMPGLALFGRLEGAVLFGEIGHNFGETQTLPDGAVVGGATRLERGQTVPVLSFLTGVSYAPPVQGRWLRFSFGYQFEQWWSLGNLNSSHGDLTFQGLFFRGEFNC